MLETSILTSSQKRLAVSELCFLSTWWVGSARVTILAAWHTLRTWVGGRGVKGTCRVAFLDLPTPSRAWW